MGIIVDSSRPQRSIPEKTIVEVVKTFQEDKKTIPIIIHSPTEKNRQTTLKIIKSLPKKVNTIECSLSGLVSVLKNIDLLLTPDVSLKYVADLAHTPSVEISLANAPVFPSLGLHPESLILSNPIHKRPFLSSSSDEKINSHDIVLVCKHILFHHNLDQLGQDTVLLGMDHDKYGYYLKLLHGPVNIFDEITRWALRPFIHTLCNERKKALP